MKAHDLCKFVNDEICCVGAGLGGGFENTNELKVMKFKEAMNEPDHLEWAKTVEDEHERMGKHHVWMPVPRDQVPDGSKIITSTWAMKKKLNGTYCARMNARGFEQIDGQHYDSNSISAPVASDITIRVVIVLMLMAGWVGELLDVKGAFLHGDINKAQRMYMEVPKGFNNHYDRSYYVLLLLQTLYG